MARITNKSLVAFKNCPHCNGTGKVPCTGREYHQNKHRLWAESLHHTAVLIPFYKGRNKINGNEEWVKVPGLAVKMLQKGGWWIVRVYISVDKNPNWGGWKMQSDKYDVINGRQLYYIDKGMSEKVIPIQSAVVVDEIKTILQLI